MSHKFTIKMKKLLTLYAQESRLTFFSRKSTEKENVNGFNNDRSIQGIIKYGHY